MIKFLPLVLAIFLSLFNFQFNNTKNPERVNFSEFDEIKNPRNHLTQDSKNRHEVTAQVISVSEASSIQSIALKKETQSKLPPIPKKKFCA